MKTRITCLALILSGTTMAQQAEITNGFDGFENWSPAETGELPDYWDGFNRNVLYNGMVVGTVTCVEKSTTDPYEGTYSAKLTSTSILGGPAVPGMLTTGDFIVDWNAQDGDITGGEAYSQLPLELSGQFKYTPVGSDTGFVSVWFMQNGVEVGRGYLNFTEATADWTAFTVPIDYDAGAAPDTMNILFSTSNGTSSVPEGSQLELDAIAFTMYLAVETIEGSRVQIYPNPSHESVTISFEEERTGSLQLINASGALVIDKSFSGTSETLSTQKLPVGTYQLRIQDDRGVCTETLVVK